MHTYIQKHIQNQNHYNWTLIIWLFMVKLCVFLDSSLKDTQSLPFLTHLCLIARAFPNFYVTLNKSMCRMNNVNIFHFSTLLSAKICQNTEAVDIMMDEPVFHLQNHKPLISSLPTNRKQGIRNLNCSNAKLHPDSAETESCRDRP